MKHVIISIFLLISFHAQSVNLLDGILAVVGENIVTYSDYYKQIELYKTQGVVVKKEDSCRILDELIVSQVLVNQARIDSVEVDDSIVKSEVERRIIFFAKQAGGISEVEKYFKKKIEEIKKDLFDVVQNQMIQQMMISNITGSVDVTPKEVKQYYEPLDKDTISDEEGRYKVAQIEFEAKESEKDKRYIIDKLMALRKRIIDGEDFAALAVLYSQDEGSAPKGGELGFLGRGELVPNYASSAFKLSEGAVSNVIRTKFGYHIIKLIERRGKKVNTQHILFYPSISKGQMNLKKQQADSVRQLLKKGSLTFKKAASLYSDDESTNNNSGVLIDPQTREAYFHESTIPPYYLVAIKNLQVGEISKSIYFETPTGKKGYRIVKLIEKVEKHSLDINKDYEKVKELALASKKQKMFNDWISDVSKTTFIKINHFSECNLSKFTQ